MMEIGTGHAKGKWKNISRLLFFHFFTLFLVFSLSLLVSGFFWAPFGLYASGGYGGGGLQQDKGRIDREKYQMGKSIYNGEFQIPEKPLSEELRNFQLERLTLIQTKLPRPEQRRVNLMELAGRLTEDQLDALQHFVSVRFNVRLDR